jgi:ABC-type Mn2+/Zn2+ transport system permease subunit
MKFTAITGIILVAAGILALFTADSSTVGLILVVAGAITLIAALFRRHGRPGDYKNSGITGIN